MRCTVKLGEGNADLPLHDLERSPLDDEEFLFPRDKKNEPRLVSQSSVEQPARFLGCTVKLARRAPGCAVTTEPFYMTKLYIILRNAHPNVLPEDIFLIRDSCLMVTLCGAQHTGRGKRRYAWKI